VPTESGVILGTPVPYEGETYQTVVIGTQTWFKRNLNYAVAGSKCGNGSSLSDANTTTCATYGRLYNWATAMALDAACNSSSCASQINPKHKGICPSGWHIPSNNDWNTLMTAVGGASTAGKYLKTGDWDGEDKYGFSALPGGYGSSNGDFYDVGDYGYWWTATEYSALGTYYRVMYYSLDNVDSYAIGKPLLYSVRCVQD
jgi:uncharacterized protein (TIGR02145 family)